MRSPTASNISRAVPSPPEKSIRSTSRARAFRARRAIVSSALVTSPGDGADQLCKKACLARRILTHRAMRRRRSSMTDATLPRRFKARTARSPEHGVRTALQGLIGAPVGSLEADASAHPGNGIDDQAKAEPPGHAFSLKPPALPSRAWPGCRGSRECRRRDHCPSGGVGDDLEHGIAVIADVVQRLRRRCRIDDAGAEAVMLEVAIAAVGNMHVLDALAELADRGGVVFLDIGGVADVEIDARPRDRCHRRPSACHRRSAGR